MKYYYINQASEQVGPVEINQLQQAGITRETLVWKEGMKEWAPAGKVPELSNLFAQVTPPPAKNPGPPPPPVAAAPSKPAGALLNKNLKKLLIPAAAIVVLAVVAAFVLFGSDSSNATDKDDLLAADTAIATDDAEDEEVSPQKDTVKIVHPDSLENKLHWDTVKVNTGESSDAAPSFLPGFGGDPSASKKNKKTTEKKPTKTTSREQSNPEQERSTPPVRTEPERINPVRYLSITGTFRKNLVLEAVLEGEIHNRYSSQMKDIIVEVRFLDANGQSISTKRFIQPGPLAAGASIPFKFKSVAPKGARSANFEIAGASLK